MGENTQPKVPTSRLARPVTAVLPWVSCSPSVLIAAFKALHCERRPCSRWLGFRRIANNLRCGALSRCVVRCRNALPVGRIAHEGGRWGTMVEVGLREDGEGCDCAPFAATAAVSDRDPHVRRRTRDVVAEVDLWPSRDNPTSDCGGV